MSIYVNRDADQWRGFEERFNCHWILQEENFWTAGEIIAFVT
jgi:hypothetical protein